MAVHPDPAPEVVGVPAVDGRSAIRDRNRNAVLDAVLDLFSEDNLSPGPEEVALRVGLSVRSVYRYFDDHDSLTRAAIARNIERVTPLFLIPAIGEGDVDGRIHVEDLEGRVPGHQFVDEDADPATYGAPRLE